MQRVPLWDTSFHTRIARMYNTGDEMSLSVKVSDAPSFSCFRNSPSEFPSDAYMMCLVDLHSARFRIG